MFEGGTYEVPPWNSAMMASLSFCTISPCIADTVKSKARIFSVNQSTYKRGHVNGYVSRICFLRSSETLETNTMHIIVTSSTINKQKTRKMERGLGVEADAWVANLQRIWATNLPSGVTEYDCLGDRQCVVKVAEGVKFPFFPLHSHEELFDALESQLITLDEDTDRVGHEFGRHLQYVVRERGT
jgi:hypothetical protein